MRTSPFLAPAILAFLVTACGPAPPETSGDVTTAPPAGGVTDLRSFLTERMESEHIPGLAVAVVKDGGVAWTAGLGFADVNAGVPMTVDTVMNVASVSKTVTNAAVLELWEDGRIDLDDDVNRYLPFRLVHPRHPEAAITFRQLLTHTSSIADGAAYDESYACGDPAVSLGDWLAGYLVEGGRFFDAGENFHEWEPGAHYEYSNVGFGLLGYLVERISGEPFSDFTRRRIFEPLGMEETSWYLAGIEAKRSAVPYIYKEAGTRLQNRLFKRFGMAMEKDGFAALCGYSFYNYPDGLLHTSVAQLTRFLLAHMGDGSYGGGRILRAETVAAIWSEEAKRERLGVEGIQGLTWSGREVSGLGLLWGHSGGDPGVSTHMYFQPETGTGVLVFANTGVALGPITRRIFESAADL